MSIEENTSNTLILYYPEIRGTIQPVRNLLFYLDVQWQELSSRNSQESEGEFNSGFPRLTHGDLQLTEITAIFRYISRISGRTDLLGLTPQSRAVINQFMFKFPQVRKKLMKIVSEAAMAIWTKKGLADEIKLNALKNFIESECKIVKNFLTLYMKNRSWVLGNLTILDFFFYEICFYLTNFLGSVIKNHAIYRNIVAFKNMFQSQQFFVNHKNQILNMKIFPQFKSKSTLQVMQNIWEGQKEIIA